MNFDFIKKEEQGALELFTSREKNKALATPLFAFTPDTYQVCFVSC